MIRLTPNLWAISAFQSTAAGVETRQLDFNLARRSALVINKIIGQMHYIVNATSGHSVDMFYIQELDTDPDNVDVEFAPNVTPDDVVLDSSRPFRQKIQQDRDTAAGVTNPTDTTLIKDWTNEPEHKRPISITSVRHHFRVAGTVTFLAFAELHIDYYIVELTLEEIGIINASRR